MLSASTGFLLLFAYIGMTLVLTEFMVKARGVAGLTGLAAFSLYFYAVAGNLSFWMIGLFVVGLLLLVVDGKLLQDGTLATTGAVFMVIGLVAPTNDLLLGVGVACALILGFLTSLLSFRVLPKRDMWEKLTLRDRFTSEIGYSTMNAAYKELVGRSGKALTDMRPSGTIEIDGKRYSAVTDGVWMEKGSIVEVTSVDGTRIMVAAPREE